MPTVSSSKPASGCLILFSLPFVGMGLFFALMSYRNLDNPGFQNPKIGMIVGLVFAAFGVLILLAGFQLYGGQRRLSAAQAAHPAEPWLWRKDWAEGHAISAGRAAAKLTWFFAFVWNAISWIGMYAALQHPPSNRWVYVAIGLFPLIGLLILGTAVRDTLRALRFGKPVLQLQTLPSPLGGKLRGTIDARLPYPLPHGINLSFSCINRVTSGTGDTRTTYDHIRWQEKKSLGSEQMMAGPTGPIIPIEFDVPRNFPASDNTNTSNEILWFVRAEADVPGVNFDETYEVPVFETRESPSLQEWNARHAQELQAHPAAAPVRPTVVVSMAPEGGTQFYFPAGRNTSAVGGFTLFAGLFTAFTIAMRFMHAPIIFPVVFGLMDLLLWWVSLTLWFATSRIVVNREAIMVYSNWLGIRTTKRWLTGEVRALYPKVTMQSGGSSGIPYYSLTLVALNGREYQIGNALSDHNEAEWLCGQIRELGSLNAKSFAAS